MKIGHYLKARREELQLKQIEVAQVIGKSSAYLTKVEKGLTTPTATFLESISVPLKLDFIDLYLRSLEDRDLPETLLTELRGYRTLRPLLEPGMPLKQFMNLTRDLPATDVKKIISIIELVTQMRSTDT